MGASTTSTAAGLAPLPVQRPIPIWLGAFAPAALRRVGCVADGWFPMVRPGGGLADALEMIAEAAREVGRDPSTIGFEGRVNYIPDDPDLMAAARARSGAKREQATFRSTPWEPACKAWTSTSTPSRSSPPN